MSNNICIKGKNKDYYKIVKRDTKPNSNETPRRINKFLAMI